MRNSSWRNAVLTISAQSISSVTNFIVVALVLSVSDLGEFGRFAIAFQACQLVITVAQGSLGDATLIHTSSAVESELQQRVRAGSSGAALALGGIAGGIIGVTALVTGGDLRRFLLLAAVGSPALVAQYVFRAQRFASDRPAAALLADVAWLTTVLAFAAGDVLDMWEASANGYLAAWLVGAAISGAPVLVRGVGSGRRALGTFWSVAGKQAVRLGTEAALARSVFVVSLVSASLFVDDAASGALAAAVLVLSPLSVVHVGISTYFVPRLIRQHGIHVPGRRTVMSIMALIGSITMLWIAAVVTIDLVGLGRGPFDLDTNGIGWGLFAATSARFLGLALWRGPLIAWRVADASQASLAVRIAATIAQWILPIIGFATTGLVGGATGLAIGTLFGTWLAWTSWASDATAED